MLIEMAPGPIFEECWSHKWAGLSVWVNFWWEKPDSLKLRAHCEGSTILWTSFKMATSMQVEAEPSVECAVQQISNIEVEGKEEEDPLEGLNNKEITEIYKKLTPEDRQLFWQFKKFHKLHYELYGHDAPSHQLGHGIINKMFSGIPGKDTEVIVAA